MRFPIRISAPWRPVLRLLGAPAERAFVDVDADAGTLRVKFGIWFDETLPLREVAEVGPSSFPWYGGLGVKLGPTSRAVSVVGSLDGVVALKFERPQRMHVLVVVHRPELRVSVEDPAAFARAVEDARERG